jgi:hypothetical protein
MLHEEMSHALKVRERRGASSSLVCLYSSMSSESETTGRSLDQMFKNRIEVYNKQRLSRGREGVRKMKETAKHEAGSVERRGCAPFALCMIQLRTTRQSLKDWK